MFIGDFDHTLDTKGRLSFPAKFREKMDGTVYITKGLENCLFVFPSDEWERIYTSLSQLPITQKQGRAFARQMLSGATEGTLDKQGRVLISPKLRKYANLQKNVSIVGVGERVEIWDTDTWINYSEDDAMSLENNAESLAELGI